MKRAAVTAFAAVLICGAPASAQDAGGLETVGSEFLSVMKSAGWKDARYARILGNEDLFEIQGFTATSGKADGMQAVSFEKLTVQGLRPDDRWTRARSLRVEGLTVRKGSGVFHVGSLFADQAGILDIDTPRRSVRFDTMVAKDVSLQLGGEDVARASEVYASGARWVGDYGIPGRLAVSAKLELHPSLLAALAGAPPTESAPVDGQLSFVSGIDTLRGEARASLDFMTKNGSLKLGAVLTEVDEPLFRAWYHLYDLPERKRSEEVQKEFAEAFGSKLGAVRLKSAEIGLRGPASPVVAALSSRLRSLAPSFLPEDRAKEMTSALASFEEGSPALAVSAYSRLAPAVSALLGKDAKELFSSFSFSFRN